MGIVSGILEASTAAARREGALSIREIHVRVGDLTEIVDEAMRFAFEALTPGTLAEGAQLVIERVAAVSRCAECSAEFSHGRFDIVCPQCEGFICEMLHGRELEVSHIEVALPGEEDKP